jgi:hypothetical protein
MLILKTYFKLLFLKKIKYTIKTFVFLQEEISR